jgi:hypothetical protein
LMLIALQSRCSLLGVRLTVKDTDQKAGLRSGFALNIIWYQENRTNII